MMNPRHTRGLTTLLALALLAPSAAFAQEGGTAPNTEPVVETPATIAPAPKGMGVGRIAPTTTRSIPPEDRMLRRASGTPAIPLEAKDMIERREAVRERIGTGTAPLDGKIRERVEEAKTRLAEARAEQMKDFVRKTIARMRAAIERLSKLADRIDSRMKKLEAAQQEAKNALSTSSEGRGKVSVQDLSLCFKCTARARAAIDEAKAALAEAEAKFASYTPPTPADDEHVPGTPTRPQPGLGQPSPIREDLKKAEAAIRTAHRALVEAIASMRNIPVAAKASDVTSSQ